MRGNQPYTIPATQYMSVVEIKEWKNAQREGWIFTYEKYYNSLARDLHDIALPIRRSSSLKDLSEDRYSAATRSRVLIIDTAADSKPEYTEFSAFSNYQHDDEIQSLDHKPMMSRDHPRAGISIGLTLETGKLAYFDPWGPRRPDLAR